MKNTILFIKATPTPAQAEAGNYPKRKLAWHGLTITLIMPSGNRHTVAPGDFSFDSDLTKATPLAPGARWITVHPNGPGTKGTPVMVQEAQHGSGVFHVIGGAGGKLNYLKISGIKPESSYKQEAGERAKAKTEIKKVKAARDKEQGLDKGKGKAREAVQMQKHQGQKAFIAKVAEKMGWKEEDLKPKIPENTTLLTQKKLEQKHHSALLEKANKAVDLQVQHLIADAQARQEAGIVPIANEHTPADQLSTADLEDARPQEKSSLGFAAHYAERAEEKGASEAVIKQEADQKKVERQANMTDNQRSAIKVRGTIAKQVQAEIAAIREPITSDIKAVLATAQDAVELIKARKAMQSLNKAAQAANKDIDDATEVKAYNLEVSEASDDQIASDIENDLRTARTTAFLSTIKKEVSDPEKQLRQHIGAGAFNSINGLAVAGAGAALVDRSVVDVLGIAGAAQVLARRLHADLTPDEVEKLTTGMEDYHLHHYMETSKTAMQDAQDLHDTAKEIGLGEASHGADFEAARELNAKRKDCIEEAHKILGTALGEMEANAALITAMKAGRGAKSFEAPLGKISDEDAIRQVRAIGLDRGDYSIDKVAGNQVLTITPQGMDKLSKPVDRSDMERTRNTLSILNGEQDEDNWLPQGFANRPDLAMNLKPGVAATLAQPFKPGADLGQSLKDYIGGRTADGDSPADIMADIQSSDFFDKSGDSDGYREALDSVAPLKGEGGKMARAESLSDTFNQYADNYVQDNYGGKISTLQRQNVEPDKVAQEALHRALSDEPAGIAAYKPIGELSNDDQRTLRDHFYANVAHESPDAAKLRERLDGMAAHEPEKETTDMFGESATNPEWEDWKSQRDTLAEEVSGASLNWQKYAGAMGGHEKAYASMQDLIRSKIGQSFHENYNKLNPSAPLKLGRQVIRGNLDHLDAVDPQARAAREAEQRQLIDGLRERVGGKYASGSVSDKLDAAREEKEAFEQSQMGFFSTEQESDDMFGGGGEAAAPKAAKPLAADERHTLGHATERTIAGMMPLIGQNFKPGQPLKLFNPTMSGPDGVMRQRSIKFIAANKRVALTAGTGCVYGGTMLKCEKTGREMSFYDWWLSGLIPMVSAVSKSGEIVTENASGPVFIKGYEEMFCVTLESGASVTVTAKHKFMKDSGEWATLDSLSVGNALIIRGAARQATQSNALDLAVSEAHKSHLEGVANSDPWQNQTGDDDSLPSMCQAQTRLLHDERVSVVSLFLDAHQSMQPLEIPLACCANDGKSVPDLLESNSEPSQLVHDEDDCRSCHKPQDSQQSYSACPHQCDEQPHLEVMGGQSFRTSQDDALECTRSGLSLDDLGNERECIHSCQLLARLSKKDSCLPDSYPQSGVELHSESSIHEHPLHSHQTDAQFQRCSCACHDTNPQAQICQSQPACSSVASQCVCQDGKAYSKQCSDSPQAPLPHGLSSYSPHEKQQENHYLNSLKSSPIVSIVSAGNSIVFDITIGECANYFTHGILHHNSGKSAMALGAFSHLQSQGKVKKGIFVVPSIVQGQMGAEANRFLEPGKFKWHCEPGASFESRLAGYKDPGTHFSVVTHQSFRDDLLKMAGMKTGETPSVVADRMEGMSRKERSTFTKEVLDHHGINFDFSTVDEGHGLLDRQGKENSRMSNAIGGVTDNTGYTISATADLVKNDISEAGSIMEKLEPEKHGDRAAFMRRYGVDTQGAKDALKREMLNSVISYKLDPKGVTANKQEISVKPSDAQSKALADLDKNIGAVRMARMEGKTNVEAMKAISPGQFKDVPEDQHEALAKELASSLGIIKGSAVRNILDSHPESAKIDALAKLATERKGKPGVVFAHSLEAVANIKKRLEADGHRVMTLTGSDSSEDKAAKIRGFNPDKGDRTHDIMVASDAGSTGANLQSGSWLTQFDTPMTAMSHAQRQGRINRVGQKSKDIELMDLVADHPSERAARERLKTKYALRELMSSPYEAGDDTGLAHFLHQRQVEQQNALI